MASCRVVRDFLTGAWAVIPPVHATQIPNRARMACSAPLYGVVTVYRLREPSIGRTSRHRPSLGFGVVAAPGRSEGPFKPCSMGTRPNFRVIAPLAASYTTLTRSKATICRQFYMMLGEPETSKTVDRSGRKRRTHHAQALGAHANDGPASAQSGGPVR